MRCLCFGVTFVNLFLVVIVGERYVTGVIRRSMFILRKLNFITIYVNQQEGAFL